MARITSTPEFWEPESQWLIHGDPLRPLARRTLGASQVRFAVRPRRLGFLVDHGDVEALKRCCAAAATIWGGRRSLILPVVGTSLDADVAKCLPFVDLDQLVDMRADRTIDAHSLQPKLQALPVRDEPPLVDATFWAPHPLASFTPTAMRTARLHLGSADSLIDLAGSGHVVLAEERRWWTESGATLIADSTAEELALAQAKGETVLALTGRGDEDYEVVDPFLESAGYVMVAKDEDDFEAVSHFWNRRATRSAGFRAGHSVLIRSEDALLPAMTHMAQVLAERTQSKPSLMIDSRSVHADTLWAIGESWGLERYSGAKLTEQFGGRSGAPARSTFAVADPLNVWLTRRRSGSPASAVLEWTRPSTSLVVSSPVRWNAKLQRIGRVMFSVAGEQFEVPRRGAVARLYHEEALWSAGELHIPTTPLLSYNFAIGLPESSAVLEAAISECDIDYVPSDKALQIDGAIAAVASADLYRHRSVIEVIAALCRPASRDIRRITEQREVTQDVVARLLAAIEPAYGLRVEQILGRCVGRSRESVLFALEALLQQGQIERGLQAQCQLCRLQSFYPLNSAMPQAACDGCGAPARYRLDAKGEPAFHYRLGSLLQRLYLNGGLAPLAAAALLLGERAFVVAGANLMRAGTPMGETDLLGWCGSTVFAGEAKMSSEGWAAFDVAADVERIASAGVDQYVCVSWDDFDSKFRSDTSELGKARGLEVRFLGRAELSLPDAQTP